MFSQITELRFFEKSHFFHFLRPKNELLRVFRDPNEVFRGSYLFLSLMKHILGAVILLTFLDISIDFGTFLAEWLGSICSIPNSWVNSFNIDFGFG